ncbi:MAG: sigma-70 family RNA polymerase sigma factor [Ilumatobacter sp.]
MTLPIEPSVLLRRVQQGDRDAFSAFYDAVSPAVFGTVKRVLRDPAMSEEVTQEVFVEIWKTVDRFDPERATASTWAVTLARRRAVDRVRHEQSQRNRIGALAGQRTVADAGPEDAVVASLDGERVQRAMSELPDDQREAVGLAFLDGRTHGDIAERLDLPLGTVKGRIRIGLKKLRNTLGEPS